MKSKFLDKTKIKTITPNPKLVLHSNKLGSIKKVKVKRY